MCVAPVRKWKYKKGRKTSIKFIGAFRMAGNDRALVYTRHPSRGQQQPKTTASRSNERGNDNKVKTDITKSHDRSARARTIFVMAGEASPLVIPSSSSATDF